MLKTNFKRRISTCSIMKTNLLNLKFNLITNLQMGNKNKNSNSASRQLKNLIVASPHPGNWGTSDGFL